MSELDPETTREDPSRGQPISLPHPQLTLAEETLRIRMSMLHVNELIQAKAFRIPIHLAFGHEALAAAVAAVMRPEDRLALTHRNIHYNLARNPDLERELAEYRLEAEGLGGGRYGAMNLIQRPRGIAYTSSILANCLPVAVGIAKARAAEAQGAVTFAVTGDGAMEEGAFYEAVLLASSLRVPVVFLVENNEWSMYTRIEERRCSIDLRKLAASFGIDSFAFRGNDVCQAHARLEEIRAQTAATQLPCVVEVELSTLGDRVVEEPGRPARTINYHHGAVPGYTLDAGPILEQSDRDPVHVLSKQFPHGRWSSLVASVRARIEGARS